MKNTLSIVLFIVLSLAFVVQAQPPVATDEPVATAQATAPAAVEAEPPAGVIEKPMDTPSESGFALIVLAISNLVAYGIILVQALLNHRSVNRETLKGFFDGLKGLAKLIPGDTDDKIVAGIEAGVNTVLGQPVTTTTVEKSTMTVQELTAG